MIKDNEFCQDLASFRTQKVCGFLKVCLYFWDLGNEAEVTIQCEVDNSCQQCHYFNVGWSCTHIPKYSITLLWNGNFWSIKEHERTFDWKWEYLYPQSTIITLSRVILKKIPWCLCKWECTIIAVKYRQCRMVLKISQLVKVANLRIGQCWILKQNKLLILFICDRNPVWSDFDDTFGKVLPSRCFS